MHRVLIVAATALFSVALLYASPTPAQAAIDGNLVISASSVTAPGFVYVSWWATGVSFCTVYTSSTADPTLRSWEDGLSGAHKLAGGIVDDTTFTLRCDRGAYVRTATVQVVGSAPTVTISASPASVPYNTPTYISWTSQNASACSAYYTLAGQPRTFWTSRLQGDSLKVGPLTSTLSVDVTCTGSGGQTAQHAVVVPVGSSPTAPTLTLTSSTSSVPSNTPAYVSWTSQNATVCNAYYTLAGQAKTFWVSRLQVDYIKIGPLTSSVVIEVTCTGANNQSTQKTLAIGVVQPPQTLQPPTPRNPSFYILPSRSIAPHGTSVNIKWQAPGNATNCHVYVKPATSNQWFGSSWYDGASHTAAGQPNGAPSGPINESMIYSLRCNLPYGTAAVSSIVLVDYPSTPAAKGAVCGITDTRMQQIRYLLDWVVVNEVNYNGLNANRQNYPQAVYDIQLLTATALTAAENCKDTYMLDRLATLYAIPFAHLEQDRNGDWVWLENVDANDGTVKRDYEQVLASSQFMYAVTKLLNVILKEDPATWTHSMYNFFTTPRSAAIGHLDRWMNKKSMWTFPECGYQQSNYLFEYTFPEYVERKYNRTMGYAAGAPAWCNMMNDIELWVGASAMELAYADAFAHHRIGLSPQLALQLTYFARSMVDYFESRISNIRSSSPLCGGACDVAGVDIGGRHGYHQYPASLWPNGNETWDISHARRLVQFVDTMYRNADISLPSYSRDAITTQLSRAITYLVFNGDFSNPAFTNFLNGVNVQYIANAPWGLSADYFGSGYAQWWPYNVHIKQINDSLTNILDNNIATSYMTPGGNPPGGNYDLLGFYSSLTRPYTPVASTQQSYLASVGAVFQSILDWFLGLFR